ncbi:hypothetical protein GF339_15410 [candidate division KSB3 bacterium]|uniref:Uncharacterized protein n=1 Tax=candidate division KSB3 bacterium TaxID=2044937 RepID=A0A9D5JXW1_9BACT|nr:hypothetical protein [candidate division KSB3 bacterium]MBD3325971.1 hypothetical protein [candidate division KSB3 bacterium]
MTFGVEEILYQLEHHSVTQMAGAVKTFPLRELLKQRQVLHNALPSDSNGNAQHTEEIQQAYTKLQTIIAKRIEAAQKIITKYATTSPEVIALKNSVFSLVPSRDVLEDVKVAYASSTPEFTALTAASANILEAVNIEIQQHFYEVSPETIAIHYSRKMLESYRKLLKNLLTHIDVASDIFKVYSTIIRNVIEGTKIYDASISVARTFCDRIFASDPPNFERVFGQYTLEELEAYVTSIQETVQILDRDITGRPSILEFADQCRQILVALTHHFANRKIQIRKSARVLQLSHYISSVSVETMAENATINLMACEQLFEETRVFLINQEKHLDASLNLQSIEEAQQKVQAGLRYRQHAVGQLFHDIATLGPEELILIPEKQLTDSNLLFQELQHLLQAYFQRIPPSSQSDEMLALSETLQETIAQLRDAITTTQQFPPSKAEDYESWESDRDLPNLSKFHDEQFVSLIRKALTTGQIPSDTDSSSSEDFSSIIPVNRLRDYIQAFVVLTNSERF